MLEWLQDNDSDLRIPIVVLSGSDHPGDIARATALRAARYLVKPITPPQLESLLAEYDAGATLSGSP